jgi:hypothetical protein
MHRLGVCSSGTAEFEGFWAWVQAGVSLRVLGMWHGRAFGGMAALNGLQHYILYAENSWERDL